MIMSGGMNCLICVLASASAVFIVSVQSLQERPSVSLKDISRTSAHESLTDCAVVTNEQRGRQDRDAVSLKQSFMAFGHQDWIAHVVLSSKSPHTRASIIGRSNTDHN